MEARTSLIRVEINSQSPTCHVKQIPARRTRSESTRTLGNSGLTKTHPGESNPIMPNSSVVIKLSAKLFSPNTPSQSSPNRYSAPSTPFEGTNLLFFTRISPKEVKGYAFGNNQKKYPRNGFLMEEWVRDTLGTIPFLNNTPQKDNLVQKMLYALQFTVAHPGVPSLDMAPLQIRCKSLQERIYKKILEDCLICNK